MQGHDPELIGRPHIAFAFCYLAAHFGLRLLEEHEVTETMDFVVSEEKSLDRMTEKATAAPEAPLPSHGVRPRMNKRGSHPLRRC